MCFAFNHLISTFTSWLVAESRTIHSYILFCRKLTLSNSPNGCHLPRPYATSHVLPPFNSCADVGRLGPCTWDCSLYRDQLACCSLMLQGDDRRFWFPLVAAAATAASLTNRIAFQLIRLRSLSLFLAFACLHSKLPVVSPSFRDTQFVDDCWN